MGAFLQKYKREAVLIAVSVLAIYGLPLLYRLLPAGTVLRGDHLLRIAAVILFGAVIWYSFSAKRRFLPILTVGILSFGMRASLYDNHSAAAVSRMADTSAHGFSDVWISLLTVGAGVCIGVLTGVLSRRFCCKKGEVDKHK